MKALVRRWTGVDSNKAHALEAQLEVTRQPKTRQKGQAAEMERRRQLEDRRLIEAPLTQHQPQCGVIDTGGE